MVIALVGRRIDASDATIERFPLRNVGIVRDRMREAFLELGAEALVTSAAAGADLIALEVAADMGIPWRIVLPFACPQFRTLSVDDRPGDWGEAFDRFCQEARTSENLRVLPVRSALLGALLETNQAILDEAELLANDLRNRPPDAVHDSVAALVVWDGQPRGDDDVAHAFVQEAKQRGYSVIEISTL